MISVIIPVYNVEKYLERCLKSVLNQSYKDFEILLIDDGSTDNSKIICDKYCERYSNKIRVFHKTNGGLSSARNFGLKNAKGKFISFIDSDDFIDKDYLKILYEILIDSNSDISCCDYLRTDKSVMEQKSISNYDDVELFIGDEILKVYLERELVSAWGKLYKKALFEGLEFPVGKINEDIATIFKVCIKANKFVYIKKKMYVYYKNNMSITKSKFSNKNMDLLEAYLEVLELSKKYSDEIQILANFRLQKVYFTLLASIAYYGMVTNSENLKLKNYLLKRFKENWRLLISSNLIKFDRKLAIIFMRISFGGCCLVGNLLRKIRK